MPRSTDCAMMQCSLGWHGPAEVFKGPAKWITMHLERHYRDNKSSLFSLSHICTFLSVIENTRYKMANPNILATNGSSKGLPPEAIAFASRMYDAARSGQLDVFQQALPMGLPANMTNGKGDSLVCFLCSHLRNRVSSSEEAEVTSSSPTVSEIYWDAEEYKS